MQRTLVLLLVVLVLAACASLKPTGRTPGPEAIVLEEVPVREFGVERCGAGSLSAVLGFYGDEISVAALDETLPKAYNGGVLSLDLLLAARQRGYRARLLEGNEELIRESLLERQPAILMLRVFNVPWERGDLYHYVVLDGVDPDNDLMRVQFGDGDARWVPIDKLHRSWKAAGFATILITPGTTDPDAFSTLRYAVALENDGRLEESAVIYTQLLLKQPDLAIAWINLGNVHRQSGRPDAAEEDYRTALDIEPEAVDALNNLAWLLFEEGGDLEEAERLARQAVAGGGPDPYLAQDTLGQILLERGRCDEATRVFKQALRSAPADPTSHGWLLFGLGQAHRDCGRLQPARENLEEALSVSQDAELSQEISRALGGIPEG